MHRRGSIASIRHRLLRRACWPKPLYPGGPPSRWPITRPTWREPRRQNPLRQKPGPSLWACHTITRKPSRNYSGGAPPPPPAASTAEATRAATVPADTSLAKTRLTASDFQLDQERAIPRVGPREQTGELLEAVCVRGLDANAGGELGPIEIGAAQVQPQPIAPPVEFSQSCGSAAQANGKKPRPKVTASSASWSVRASTWMSTPGGTGVVGLFG